MRQFAARAKAGERWHESRLTITAGERSTSFAEYSAQAERRTLSAAGRYVIAAHVKVCAGKKQVVIFAEQEGHDSDRHRDADGHEALSCRKFVIVGQ
ncbi:hypothetical protein DXZ75_04745 [Streptomyces sp. AcE210]|nr:hypothetical protein DXZ75_04745 [Streptomyces sp. AcE210]